MDNFNPALTSIQVNVAENRTPNSPLDPFRKLQEAFASLIYAFGGSSFKTYGGCLFRGSYGAVLPTSLPTNPDNSLVISAAGLRPYSASNPATNTIAISPNLFTNPTLFLHLPHLATGSYYINFSIPLLSIIGLNSMDKLLPTRSINSLQLQVMTSPLLPVVSYCTAVATQPGISAPVIHQFVLNMRYIDVGDARVFT